MFAARRSLSIAGLDKAPDAPWSAGPRRAIDWALSVGTKAVQLDAALPGLRPRELDQSARRDLAAVLRRAGAACSGLDLWIPEPHFTDPAQQNRAVDAIEDAASLAADLRRLGAIDGLPAVSIRTHAETPSHLTDRLARTADHLGAALADHRWPRDGTTLPVGIDPASLLMSGHDPATTVARLASPPAAARLSDASALGRCVPGAGSLRIDDYEVALSVARYAGWLVIDLRGIPNQAEAAARLTAG